MNRIITRIIILSCFIALITSIPALAVVENEGGILVDVGRVLHGASSGTRYYGYTVGTITLPHDRGGLFSFSLWNDVEVAGQTHTNVFNAEVGGMKIRIPNYATRNQMAEEYAEHRGSWGAAGSYTVTIAIPPGLKTFSFNNAGSETGIELSHLSFTDGYHPLNGGFVLRNSRPFGEPLIRVGRILNGTKTGRKYYGHSEGSIHLPHGNGGFLSFKLWNDQHTGFNATHNKINITAGTRQESYTQYSTSLDILEHYKETINEWGAGGGGEVIIQIPENIFRVDFNNSGSETGIEISDVTFTQGAPIVFQFKERVNTTSEVLNNFGRILHGANTGRVYYGHSAGTIILPHSRGGVLKFLLWNDHQLNSTLTSNLLNVSAGSQKNSIKLDTTKTDRMEFYKETMNDWGPAGGIEVRVTVPVGITKVEINNTGSQTGIELSDLFFTGN
jgi:hypothetical protein